MHCNAKNLSTFSSLKLSGWLTDRISSEKTPSLLVRKRLGFGFQRRPAGIGMDNDS
jgi:hypothetical protein